MGSNLSRPTGTDDIEIVAPEGVVRSEVERLAPRVKTLNGVVLGILDNAKPNADEMLDAIAERLVADNGVARVVRFSKNVSGVPAKTESIKALAAECSVVITGSGDCGSCTSWTISDAIELERQGVATVSVVTTAFELLGEAEAKLLGMPGLPLAIVPHPIGNLPSDDIAKVGADIAPTVASLLLESPNPVAVDPAASHPYIAPERAELVRVPADAQRFLDYCMEVGWSEGFPLVPPTPERVAEAIAATGREPNEMVGVIPPRRGIATVEIVAANAVMAGCRPEYVPVVLAAVEGVCKPAFNLYGVQATTGSVTPLVTISGPIGDKLGISGSFGCLGPGYRANAAIGRALRLVMWNAGGGRPGKLDRATHGQPGKYSMCMAENEAECPWPSFRQENGFSEEDTVVRVAGVMGTADLIDYSSTNTDDLLTMLSSGLAGMAVNHVLYGGYSTLILCPEHAEALAKDGYSRRDVQQALVDRSWVGYEGFPEPSKETLLRKRPQYFVDGPPTTVPAFDSAEHLTIIVAGGPGPHSVLCPAFGDLTDPQVIAVVR